MPLVFSPSKPITRSKAALHHEYWFAWWDRLVPFPVELTPGGIVYLYEAATDTLVWHSSVSEVSIRPLDHTDAAREQLARRWRVEPSTVCGSAPSPGYAITWRVTPTERPLPPRFDRNPSRRETVTGTRR